MKHLLCSLFTITLFASCGTDDSTISQEHQIDSARDVTADPANLSNPYDVAGRLHRDLTENFIFSNYNVTTIENTILQVELLAGQNPEFTLLRPRNYQIPSASRIGYILAPQPGRVADVIAMSALTSQGKLSLTNYLDKLQWFRETGKTYEDLYNFIIEYEASVLDNSNFTENDRRILLCTAAISRYGINMQKRKVKRRDRDWELSIGNFLTGAEGAGNNVAESITMSIVAGITDNK